MNYLTLIHFLALFNHTIFSPQISAKANILKTTLWEMCLWLQLKGEITHSFNICVLKSDQHVLQHSLQASGQRITPHFLIGNMR